MDLLDQPIPVLTHDRSVKIWLIPSYTTATGDIHVSSVARALLNSQLFVAESFRPPSPSKRDPIDRIIPQFDTSADSL